jgi:hypothetical protein
MMNDRYTGRSKSAVVSADTEYSVRGTINGRIKTLGQ